MPSRQGGNVDAVYCHFESSLGISSRKMTVSDEIFVVYSEPLLISHHYINARSTLDLDLSFLNPSHILESPFITS